MLITFKVTWYTIPTIITITSLLCAVLLPKKTGSYYDSLEVLFWLLPALGISLVSWIITAICK